MFELTLYLTTFKLASKWFMMSFLGSPLVEFDIFTLTFTNELFSLDNFDMCPFKWFLARTLVYQQGTSMNEQQNKQIMGKWRIFWANVRVNKMNAPDRILYFLLTQFKAPVCVSQISNRFFCWEWICEIWKKCEPRSVKISPNLLSIHLTS